MISNVIVIYNYFKREICFTGVPNGKLSNYQTVFENLSSCRVTGDANHTLFTIYRCLRLIAVRFISRRQIITQIRDISGRRFIYRDVDLLISQDVRDFYRVCLVCTVEISAVLY